MPRPRKNALKRAIVCLCIAPVLVVAVAWCLSFYLPVQSQTAWIEQRITPSNSEHVTAFGTKETRGFGGASFLFAWIEGLTGPLAEFSVAFQPMDPMFPAWMPPIGTEFDSQPVTYHVAIGRAHGWPMLAMSGFMVWDEREDQSGGDTSHHMVIEVGSRWSGRRYIGYGYTVSASRQPRFIPLRPLYPGFIGNTLIYAVTMWLSWTGFIAVKRRRRLKRGLCPACAYPIGESECCSECGEGLPTMPKT